MRESYRNGCFLDDLLFIFMRFIGHLVLLCFDDSTDGLFFFNIASFEDCSLLQHVFKAVIVVYYSNTIINRASLLSPQWRFHIVQMFSLTIYRGHLPRTPMAFIFEEEVKHMEEMFLLIEVKVVHQHPHRTVIPSAPSFSIGNVIDGQHNSASKQFRLSWHNSNMKVIHRI